ncbi:MAG TPA: type 2 lanthipeptide synthetase LanM family protein, partial [Kofleriaceae bacterium]
MADSLFRVEDAMRAELSRLGRLYPALAAGRSALEEVLVDELRTRLLTQSCRALILSLHIAKHGGQLTGDTREARYDAFCELIRSGAWIAEFFAEYPLLARRLALVERLTIAAHRDLLRHLTEDWPALSATFGIARDARLTSIDGSLGDPHRGGRSVHQLGFSDGTAVIYKPRDVGIEARFAGLLTWLGERTGLPAIRQPRALERGDHGWVERVQPAPCSGREEVEQFFERYGALVAIVHALCGTDCHEENVIAVGSQPTLVDVECLFHQRVQLDGNPLEAFLRDSVLSTGLLPHRVWAGDGAGLDMSAMGGGEERRTPFLTAEIADIGTDEMAIRYGHLPVPGAHSLPRLDGQRVTAARHSEAVARGFAAAYRGLMENRDALLAADGPLAGFAEVETRVLIRPSEKYARLLRMLSHPDALRDEAVERQLLEKLHQGAERVEGGDLIVAAEIRSLRNLDIPLFATTPGSRDLVADGALLVRDFFAQTGLEACEARIRSMSEAHLRHQTWLLQSALASTRTMSHGAGSRSLPGASARSATSTSFSAAAGEIAEELLATQLSDGDGGSWIGLSPVSDRRDALAVGPVGADLYDGTSGIALFLGYAGEVLESEACRAGARKALASALAVKTQLSERGLGAFIGSGGLVYALSHLGALWGDRDLYAAALDLARSAATGIEESRKTDVIDGVAGFLLSALALHAVSPEPESMAIARRCGDFLLARARVDERGMSWAFGDEPALLGFSHGASGIGYALGALAAACGESRYLDSALAAFRFERAHFSQEAQNWPDLRPWSDADEDEAGEQTAFISAWCHGAPGIGLARLGVYRHHQSEVLRDELTTAVETTLEAGLGRSHCLCHGDLGNLDLILGAARALRDEELEERARLRGAEIIAQGRSGWRCGLPLAVSTPGLMTGMAGI